MNINKVIDLIETDFKGKAIKNGACSYKTSSGKKCFIGLFIPEGHKSQSEHDLNVGGLLQKYGDLKAYMPTSSLRALRELQFIHDDGRDKNIEALTLAEQKMYLQFSALNILGE